MARKASLPFCLSSSDCRSCDSVGGGRCGGILSRPLRRCCGVKYVQYSTVVLAHGLFIYLCIYICIRHDGRRQQTKCLERGRTNNPKAMPSSPLNKFKRQKDNMVILPFLVKKQLPPPRSSTVRPLAATEASREGSTGRSKVVVVVRRIAPALLRSLPESSSSFSTPANRFLLKESELDINT